MVPGTKVFIIGREEAGFGEVAGGHKDGDCIEVRFFTNAVSFLSVTAPRASVRRALLPAQTRCFRQSVGVTRYGRVIACGPDTAPLRTYLVQFAGETQITPLAEDQFAVRSYLAADDPIEILANIAHETPFFFEQRRVLLWELLRQNRLCHGLPALLSSKIEVLPHQVEIAARILRDPTIRYLLADEVGLGKTIEAGIVLRQLRLDAPGVRSAVFAPGALVRQWRDELDGRFCLHEVPVYPHSSFDDPCVREAEWDLLVIDEAHRVVARTPTDEDAIAAGARALARRVKHLLLLSATPVLHHDADLLALLELLDPTSYSRADIAGFRKKTERRLEVGRAFLALRSAKVPALVKLNAGNLAKLLPDDSTVGHLAAAITKPGADVSSLQRELHLHISETYRIHRRLLRTRRRWLAEIEARFVRNVKECWDGELDEEPHSHLWSILEEWRTEAAARISDDAKMLAICAAEYVKLAEIIAADPERLESFVIQVAEITHATERERELLCRLAASEDGKALAEARLQLIVQVLRQRRRKDGDSAKFVVFCPTVDLCQRLAKALWPNFSPRGVRLAHRGSAQQKAGDIFADFAADDAARVLVTDATGEEGLNLQFARAVLFHDLPWAPMRIEQRLGRLDRIDRTGSITCIVITTGEDDTLAVDEAWRRVLAEGFGIYKDSLSDLQHLIDEQMPRLRERAFLGGPSALCETIPALIASIRAERETIEEQDVIDGIHSHSSGSEMCPDLASADATADEFARALTLYLKANVGLRQWWDEETNSFTYGLPRDYTPLIPADRLEALARVLNAPFTVHRGVAIEDFRLQFLRPGHPGIDACRDLLKWDDRGRAFAMWRHFPGAENVKVVFRTTVHVSVELERAHAVLEESGWDAIASGGLLRMVRGWFPDFIAELFLDEKGKPVPTGIIEACRRPYDNRIDINLGKERVAHLRAFYGVKTWRELCMGTRERAIENVSTCEELKAIREQAERAATEHFAMLSSRINARRQVGIEADSQVTVSLKHEKALQKLVMQIFAEPIVRLDSIGAYLLSDKPFWEEGNDCISIT
jgi:ATP-dependent helicase HepA